MPWLTISLGGLMVTLFITFGPAAGGLIFDRVGIVEGGLWRLLTAHLVHTDSQHLAWNLAALLLLGSYVERAFGWQRMLRALLVGASVTGLSIALLMPSIGFYCGLSGVLNTLLLLAMYGLWRVRASPLIWLLGIGSLLKITAELLLGQALLTHTAWASLPEAHLAGWLAGVVCVLGLAWRNRSQGSSLWFGKSRAI